MLLYMVIENLCLILSFLKLFYDVTLLISSSTYVIDTMYDLRPLKLEGKSSECLDILTKSIILIINISQLKK